MGQTGLGRLRKGPRLGRSQSEIEPAGPEAGIQNFPSMITNAGKNAPRSIGHSALSLRERRRAHGNALYVWLKNHRIFRGTLSTLFPAVRCISKLRCAARVH